MRKFIPLTLVLLTGCVAPQQMFGNQKPVTADMKEQVIQGARDVLKDPYSIRDAEISYAIPDQYQSGYFVCIRANARNSFGGYTGRKNWLVSFKNGKLISASEGHAFCNYAQIKWQPFPEIYRLRNL